MKILLESTTRIVTLFIDGSSVQARVWEGSSESGIEVHAFITRIAAPRHEDLAAFDRELLECRDPSPVVASLPPGLIF